MRRFFLPTLAASSEELSRHGAHAVNAVLHKFKGHRMAKAALEMAVLDAELRAAGRSWARELGAVHDRVPSGVSVGIFDSIPQLLDVVGGYLDAGYVRIKLKIEPGWDVEPVRAVRERFGDDVLLQVDANTAYTLRDARHLAKLDDFDLLLIEQPLEEEDVLGHAELARLIRTPVCLDESIVSAQTAAAAISVGACSIINIKPGRVGGYLEAVRIHDVAAAHGLAVWCGGMIETGLGRAANAALAALPGFTLPGDISASDRFYRNDITAPLTISRGLHGRSRRAGSGRHPDPRAPRRRHHLHRVDRASDERRCALSWVGAPTPPCEPGSGPRRPRGLLPGAGRGRPGARGRDRRHRHLRPGRRAGPTTGGARARCRRTGFGAARTSSAAPDARAPSA